MAEPLGYDEPLWSGPLPIDKPSPVKDMTYRDLVKELDGLGFDDDIVAAGGESGLSQWEIGFVADAIDNPERFKTPKQLATIVKIYERHFG